jgi:hypothetical protein
VTRVRRGFGAALTLTALAAASAAARADASAPPGTGGGLERCRATVSLDPPDPFVGQAVLHRLRVVARSEVGPVEWARPPAFPGLRVERLAAPPAAALAPESTVRVHEELRVLFPQHAGEIALPVAELHCRVARGDAAWVFPTPVPGARLRVRRLPPAARPPGFDGVVGAFGLRQPVSRDAISLGESVRLLVVLEGGANLWDASDPLPDDDAFGGADVFRRRPELELERGARLNVRRRFAYDLVPRRPGVFRVPQARVAWFDPASRRYGIATATPLEVRVTDAPAPAAP